MVTESKPIRFAEAKARLGRLAEWSRKGKTVRFIARSGLFEIVHVKRPVVVPATEEQLRVCYSDPEENALVNRLEMAVGLYASEDVTLGQAADIAGIDQTRFLHELGRHGVCVHYGIEDFEQDLRTLNSLGRA